MKFRKKKKSVVKFRTPSLDPGWLLPTIPPPHLMTWVGWVTVPKPRISTTSAAHVLAAFFVFRDAIQEPLPQGLTYNKHGP